MGGRSACRFNIDSETHDPLSVQEKKSLETNSMVEEFMLLANISVAEAITDAYPDTAVLRRHPVPPPANYKPVRTVGPKIYRPSGSITYPSGSVQEFVSNACEHRVFNLFPQLFL